jgi:DNA-binding transcriptional ArsR family regulator
MDGIQPREGSIVEADGSCNLKLSAEMLDLVASRFRTLGEPYRLRILQVLRPGAMTVGQIVEILDGNQSNISRHLQNLHQAGIVSRRRDGSSIIYSFVNPEVLKLCELVHRNLAKTRIGSRAR